jgi:hypothetical protein
MPTDLEQQLATLAEALDRAAPAISFDEVARRGPVAVDVGPQDHQPSDRAARVGGVRWVEDMPRRDGHGDPDVIELAPAVADRRPAWRRMAWKVALGAAAAVLVVTLATIEGDGDGPDPVVDVPDLTTTFVSPRNGYSIRHPEGASVRPAVQLWGWAAQVDDGFDVVEIDPATVIKGTSREFPGDFPCLDDDYEPISCGTIDDRIDRDLSQDLPGGCGVPRSQQAETTIDGQRGRVAECPGRIEATVVHGGRLYVFVLAHERSDARAVFDAAVATIDLTPETGVDFLGLTETFVSPTYGYTFGYIRGIQPATDRWDPSSQPLEERNLDRRFDAVETGYGAYLEGASTKLPDGISVDAWVDEFVTPRTVGGCGVPRSQQAQITIDGEPGRVAECADQIEATVVAGGRLYLFVVYRDGRDARAMFDAWVATIDLTPETAAVP